jgi:uncharacterized protein (DUF2164 family)
MAITLKREVEQRCAGSIKRYFTEEMGEEVGDLKAKLILDFCLRELAPSIYNQAVSDVQALLVNKIADLEGECFQPEFGYWKDRPSARKEG